MYNEYTELIIEKWNNYLLNNDSNNNIGHIIFSLLNWMANLTQWTIIISNINHFLLNISAVCSLNDNSWS